MINSLEADTTLLTPNRRLAATLLKKYNQSQVDAGKSCWARLDVLPFTSWIQRLWHDDTAKQITTAPFLLTAQQELVLWEEILRKFPANEALLQLSKTAELAKSAWGILKQWQIDLTHSVLETTEDSNTFLLWATDFERKCKKNNWLDANSVIQLVCEKILTGQIKPAKHLIAMGFTEFSPLQKYLFSCCEQMGTQIIYDAEPSHASTLAQRIELVDEETEIRTMARWAKSLITSNAALTIGCVVPQLENKRDDLLAVFSEVFCEEQLYGLECTSQPFNITAGKSLASYPIIHAALELLGLNKKTITTENLSALLLSPFLGDAECEQIKRAQFDARLRKANITNTSLQKLMDTQEKLNLYTHCPRLAIRLKGFLTLTREQPALSAISTWITVFTEALSLLGWPGERSINSQEYQIVHRWLELLDEYRAFDILLAKKNYQNTLHYLTRLTANVIFQPQSSHASVQILGVLEATALPFDHTWVMGFDDSAWPPAAQPNPFIPHRLQATLKMPHSSAEHEFEYSKRLTEQLIQSTQHIIFSHVKNSADRELRPSSLISELPVVTTEHLSLSQFISLAEKCKQSQLIETFQDTQASAVQIETLHGGAAIFKLQAACPFKAFAEIRLNAKPLESTTLGLKPQDRGKITHKALELVWLEIKTSERLHTYTEMELKSILTNAIIAAIQSVTGQDTLRSRYLSLEIKRLQNLLWYELEIEKLRPSFKVLSQEEERVVSISDLPIRLRIDRIDELADGSQLIIDYKTGKNNQIKYWFGDRLDEPQLPLYCITTSAAVAGIAFAEINSAGVVLKGISKQDIATDAIKPLSATHYSEGRSWEKQLLHWQHTLEKLARDFANGHAEVDPKVEVETCSHCQLQAFCRVDET